MQNNNSIILEGMISVVSSIRAGNRDILGIWIDERKRNDRRALGRLPALARFFEIPLDFVHADAMREHLSGGTSGGILAFASERRYLTPDELQMNLPKGPLAALEGFEDPYNFGYAVRALYAAGFGGLLMTRHHWGAADGIIVRASAGASEWMPTACGDAAAIAEACRRSGIRIVCLTQSPGAASLFHADLTAPSLIVIGGEKRGISRAFVEAADQFVEIPYAADFRHALAGVSAASVVAFETMRQRSGEHAPPR